ncbi:MAG: fused response regulator/phosphatase [Acidobacteria bacterium]|nr:fused response regulator/phosphatase [Acidobacteriota bacterium]
MPGETILVIDDNEDDLALMRRVLGRNGYSVLLAEGGAEGLEKMLAGSPDAVLVDYRMPGMDGYEVSRRIKADERNRNIPVLILTGADSSENMVAGLDAGADDFVTKSADVEVILARLRALLRVKAYQDQLRNLYDELKEKSDEIMALNQRLNKDLQFARKVQEALLPPRQFEACGVEIRSAYLPSETLSGDFYDYFQTGPSLLIFVADVSGHGLPAAILTSLLKSYLHSEAEQLSSPAIFMSELNEFLCSASLPSQYATGLLLMYDREQGTIRFSNAAHPPFLLYRHVDGTVETTEVPGHMLGAIEGVGFDENAFHLSDGDMIFAYSDGLTDRISTSGDFYSTERIAEILKASPRKSLSAIHDDILADVTSFSQTEDLKDDVAMVLMRFGG